MLIFTIPFLKSLYFCIGNTQPKDISEHLTNLFNLVNKMTKDKNQMIGNTVTHTLEFIYLLIGEVSR